MELACRVLHRHFETIYLLQVSKNDDGKALFPEMIGFIKKKGHPKKEKHIFTPSSISPGKLVLFSFWVSLLDLIYNRVGKDHFYQYVVVHCTHSENKLPLKGTF